MDEASPPPGFEYLWDLFWEIRSGASGGGMDGVRLSWRDLADYQSVTGIPLDPFEVEAIMAMDAAARTALEE